MDPRGPARGIRLIVVIALLGVAPLVRAEPPKTFPLDAHAKKVFSQFGEDGVIERVFEIVEPTRKYVVEFGAHDGVTNSNARNLIVNHGWSAFLIEGDDNRAAELAKAYAGNDKVKTAQAWVYPGNIEILFEEAGVPTDFDLLVIDIDSNDYYVWRAIQSFRPKVCSASEHCGPRRGLS